MNETSEALNGRRVVVTGGTSHQAGELAAAFAAAGAEVELLPLLEVLPPADPEPLDEAAATGGSYDWVVFTTANAVEAFVPLMPEPFPESVTVAAVGTTTAQAVRRLGVEVNVVATRVDAEDLVEELAPHLLGDERILLLRAEDAPDTLAQGLEWLGCDVTAVDAYRKVLAAGAAARARGLFDGREIGGVTFTSPRTVRHFAALFGEDWQRRREDLRAVSIGAATSRELRRHGVAGIAEALEPSPAAMVRALVASL
jgi:uroporphyrinogen-III synthase